MHAHTDKLNDKTYSIKVGKTIPPNSVNLAYVNSDDLTPEYNIEVADYAEYKRQQVVEMTAEPSPDFVLRSVVDGNSYIDTRNVEISDEFSIKRNANDKIVPLYYKAHLSKPFNRNNGGIILNPGYTESLAQTLKTDVNLVPQSTDTIFLYLGDKVKVTKNEKTVSPSLYKVILTKTDANTCSIDLYTSFKNSTTETYKVVYQSTTGVVTETLNAYGFFSQDDDLISQLITETQNGEIWDARLNSKVYTTREQDGKYQIFAPTHLLVADQDTRPSQKFRYKLEANLDVRYSIDKPCSINIGMVYLNALPDGNRWFDAEDVSDTLVKIKDHAHLPSYVTLVNPHPIYGSIGSGNYDDERDNPNYWLISLDTTEDFINDYDIIIISGYGQYDLTGKNYMLKKFLEKGGSLWIDNCGTSLAAFDPANDASLEKFIVDVQFSQTINNISLKEINDANNKMFNRVWNISDVTSLGYRDIGPKIEFGSNELLTDWTPIIKYANGNPCITQKKYFGKGTVIVSTCGITRAIHGAEGDDIKLFINAIIGLKENTWVHTPWIHDNVIHRNNIFSNEYKNNTEGFYEDGYSLTDSSTKVAKKVLCQTVLAGLDKYADFNYDIVSGQYFISVEQVQTLTEQGSAYPITRYATSTNVKTAPLTSLQSQVYVYTTVATGDNSFNITSEGMKNGYFKIYYEPITVRYTIYAFYYEWDGKKYTKDIKSTITREISLSKEQGVVNVGLFESLLPELETDMSDLGKVFFEVSLSYADAQGRVIIVEDPVNVQIYDPRKGSFIYDNKGDAIISYSDLYSDDNNRHIRLYMWTDYQTIAVNTRRFGVKAINDGDIFVTKPATFEESMPWYLRVHNGSYKTAVDTTRTLVENGLHPEFSYELPEYYNQVYSPAAPYMKAYNEKVAYIDYHKVKLAKKNLFVDRGSVVNETLTLVSAGVYKTQHKPIETINVSDDNGVMTAEIDYEYGTIKPLGSVVGTLKATYTWDNIKAVRREYGKQASQKEKLIRLDNNSFQSKKFPILINPIPKLFVRISGVWNQLQGSGTYSIDYETGIINFKNTMVDDVYITYTHANDTELTIVDYDVVSGVLSFKETINFTDDIFVTYHYTQDHYEYRGYVDENGVLNHLDLNPSEGHSFLYKNTPTPSSSLINKSIYVYMLPRKITNFMYYTRVPSNLITMQDGKPVVNIVDQSSAWDSIITPIDTKRDQLSYLPWNYIGNLRSLTGNISSNPDNILNDALSDTNKRAPYIDGTMGLIPVVEYNTDQTRYPDQVIIGGYLINNSVVRHTFDKREFEEIQTRIAGVKLLAVIHLKENKFDITMIDARKRGGGIKETISTETIHKKNGAQNLSYWDISTWDGMAYQKNGTVVITLPKEVLEQYGGHFTKAQVDEHIKQFIALGVFWIVEYI